MKTKLFLMCVTAASTAYCGVAMPTEAEVGVLWYNQRK